MEGRVRSDDRKSSRTREEVAHVMEWYSNKIRKTVDVATLSSKILEKEVRVKKKRARCGVNR